MEEIESESKFVWKFIWHVLLTPITFILILFKKKEWKDLLLPFRELVAFVFEPKFTISIIILNVLIFLLSIFFFSEELFVSLINFPLDLLLLRFHTLFTAGFLHGSWDHLLGNMLGIFIFGRVIERKLGFWKTAGIYFGALFISSLFSSLIGLLMGNNIGGIGASGALMGLVAVAILLNPFYLTYEAIVPLPVMFIGWLTIFADISGVLNPTQDGIGHFAHIGGFISVALLAYFMGVDEKSKLKTGLIINVVSLVVVGVLYFLFIA